MVPEGSLAASQVTAIISAGHSSSIKEITEVTTATLELQFNSGAMLWRKCAQTLTTVQAVLDFDDATYDGSASCDCGITGGCGDQWALCGSSLKDPSLLDGVVAYSHPAVMQRCLLYNDGAVIFSQLLDWPPQAEEQAFVINCAGDDPLGCAMMMHHIYYPNNEDAVLLASPV